MSSELPDGWLTQPLEALCARVSVGHVGETSSFFVETGGVPFLRSQNVRPNSVDLRDIKLITHEFHAKSGKSSLRGGDLLIVRVGQNRGDCAVLPADLGEVNCANIVFARPDRSYSDFLGAYFNTPQGRNALLAVSSGSAQLVLNTRDIAKIEVPVPPPLEALAIGHIGRRLEDRITLLREANATLEAIAQALFKSWFVDFDPVRAKRDGRAPEGMDEATAALFPDSFEDSELGEVPRGWQIVPYSNVCGIASGKRPPDRSDDQTESCPIPLYGGAGPMGFTSQALFTTAKIVTGRVGTLGKVHVAYPPFWASDNVLVVSPEKDEVFAFALHWLRTIDVSLLNRGSTQPLLTQRDLGSQKGVLPPPTLLEAFESIASALFVRMRAQERQAETLSVLRDSLLPRLISGQLRLPEVANEY